jgi:hypothetical protein
VRNQERADSDAVPVVFGKVLRKKHANDIRRVLSWNQVISQKLHIYQILKAVIAKITEMLRNSVD